MPRLLAIALPTGPAFVRHLTAAWDVGDAVLPVDPRLPKPALAALLEELRPAVLIDGDGEHQQLRGARPTADGDAVVVATSGTTGTAKGVVLTHEAIAASARASSARLAVDPNHDAWLALLPVAHIGGLSVLTRALVTGTPLLFDPDDPRATLVSLVPTQANRLDLGRFRVVLVGGSADWRDRSDHVVHTYGLTETGSGVAYDGTALNGVDLRIDGGGEIHLRGPMLLRGYRDGSDPKSGGGWLATGDSGRVDVHGRLHVDGRLGDVVVTGGEKVWPTPVEDALRSHPDVVDVAVGARPDAEWGQRVVAWIVPRDRADPPSLDALRDHARRTIPAYACPREVVVVLALPRTSIGKIRRNLLNDGL